MTFLNLHPMILFVHAISQLYTRVYLPVAGDNVKPLASGLSHIQVDKPW